MGIYLFGSSVEHQLAGGLDRLINGELELWQITPSLAGIYHLGHRDGQQHRQAELDRLTRQLEQAELDRDRYYERLFNPGKKFSDMAQRRLDQAAEAHAGEPDSGVAFINIMKSLAARDTQDQRTEAA